MGALTNYAESGILNYLFRDGTFAKPTDMYVGLLTAYDPDELEKGNIANEVVGGGYERKKYPCSDLLWTAPYTTGTAMMIHNYSGVEFPVATATIGLVSGVFLTSNDKVLFYGALTTPKLVRLDDQFVFSSGALKITFD